MPYTYTPKTQKAWPVKSFAGPKTHTPGSRVKNLGHRYCIPALGRWLSRDPAAEGACVNVYCAFDNTSVNDVDILGLWNTDVHKDKTFIWAVGNRQFTFDYGIVIADADEGVDNDFRTVPYSPTSISRHMKRLVGEQDSRYYWYDKEYGDALDALNKRNCKEAAQAFGSGLHSRQDKSAHRAWPDWLRGHGWPTTYWVSWHRFYWAAHPKWWDSYTEVSDMTGIGDDLWRSVGRREADYYPWTGSSEQQQRQANARKKVGAESLKALNVFEDDVRKSCCAKEMLAR